jgi:hypothetical protein
LPKRLQETPQSGQLMLVFVSVPISKYYNKRLLDATVIGSRMRSGVVVVNDFFASCSDSKAEGRDNTMTWATVIFQPHPDVTLTLT